MSLKTFASIYQRQLNRAVIPVNADKTPMYPWMEYKNRLATETELERWFIEHHARGLAVVLGDHLACFDLDSRDLYKEFRNTFPDLAQTQRELSPRGAHLLYYVDPGTVESVKAAGRGSFLYDGQYVVRAPTPGYHSQDGRAPLKLTSEQYQTMIKWLKGGADNEPTPPAPRQPDSRREPANPRQLLAVYGQYLTRGETRNDALFKTVLWGHNNGISIEAAFEILEWEFALSPAAAGHRRESQKARRAEFSRTVKSAYRYQTTETRSARTAALPNRIRETCAQRGITFLWRVLESLYQGGVIAGQQLTRRAAVKVAAAAGVGRDSVLKALESGCFSKVSPRTPLTNADAVLNKDSKNSNQCTLKGDKASKNYILRGRRPNLYIMPALPEVSKWLNIAHDTRGDTLGMDDIASAKNTRESLLREYVRRNPGGSWSNRWQADRLGVSVKTIKRYKQNLKLESVPQFDLSPVNFANVETLPAPKMGVYLKDQHGRKYPTVPGLARKLLGDDSILALVIQKPNKYALQGAMPKEKPAKMPKISGTSAPKSFLKPEYATFTHTPAAPAPKPESPAPEIDRKSDFYRHIIEITDRARVITPLGITGLNLRPSNRYARPLTDTDLNGRSFEDAAQQVYQTLNAIASDKKHRVSIAAARKLVYEAAFYSGFTSKVTRHLDTIQQKAAEIRKPYGYLTYLIKSTP